MNLINSYTLKIKKSKFIGYFYEINDLNDINNILDTIKKEHKKAKHFPYAYKINNIAKKTDDKEPSGTCGTPILNVLERNNLNNHLIAIVRFYGGIKLGASNLSRTYGKCASICINR